MQQPHPNLFTSLDDFSQTVRALIGMPICEVSTGKHGHKLLFGTKQEVEIEGGTNIWIKASCSDYTLRLGENWQLLKHKKVVNEQERISGFGPFQKVRQTLYDLVQARVQDIVVTSSLGLHILFTDDYEIVVSGINDLNDKQASWGLSTPTLAYDVALGVVTIRPIFLSLFPHRFLTS